MRHADMRFSDGVEESDGYAMGKAFAMDATPW